MRPEGGWPGEGRGQALQPSGPTELGRAMVLSLIASGALFASFVLNWEMNRGAYLVVEKSEVLRGLSALEGGFLALLIAIGLVLLGLKKERLPFPVTLWHVVGGIILVFVLILVVTQNALLTYVAAVQLFLVAFYSAPLLFGLCGLFLHKPVYLIISAMFSFFITAGTPNSAAELPGSLLFALCFLLYVEVGESSIRCWLYLEEGRLSRAHADGFAGSYLRHLAIFLPLALLLSLLVLNLPAVIGALGQRAVASSLEMASIYGRAAAAVTVLGGLGLLRFLHDRGYTSRPIDWAKRFIGWARGAAPRAAGAAAAGKNS
ncbi:MAG: hypothetical protein ACUVV6_00055 [Thermoplasmatota archaeon]